MPPKINQKTLKKISPELAADLFAVHGIRVPLDLVIEVEDPDPDETYSYADYLEETE